MPLIDDVDPSRVLEDLAALRDLTADEFGVQRVAWTETWRQARSMVANLLASTGSSVWRDEAGNMWASPTPDADRWLVIGSHLDSVRNGGNLDGALGVLAGVEVLRSLRETGRHGAVALVDFADEEGARFGFSLFGSTALTGKLPGNVGDLTDPEGSRMTDVLADNGVALRDANLAQRGLAKVGAYLELHIEQDLELERQGVSVAAVTGATGIERLLVTMSGQSTHAGSIAMEDRRDPTFAAADAINELRGIVSDEGSLLTVGRIEVQPNIPTAVASTTAFTVDLRADDQAVLSRMAQELHASCARAAGAARCEVTVQEVWSMPITPFDPELVGQATRAAASAGGSARQVLSARGHDCVVLAQVVPAVMLFVPSVGGLSHCREETTADADVEAGVRALADLADRVLSA
jgi:N-carbamoyl-L-amino-acid hydrolase